TYAYESPLEGRAKFIHTYKAAGDPLPSFEGEPKTLELPDCDIDSMTKLIWDNLNSDNKVSLFVRYIDIATGKYESRIVNKNK
ncbi:MAG: inosine monophosphate cyclohydrolase, partial [Oscillospiraceae bacterium]|nr:inosine monophosphate cyclohydrolase [Oscillospiraceae bacterium]